VTDLAEAAEPFRIWVVTSKHSFSVASPLKADTALMKLKA
jgi:hypothetical protein